MTRVTAGASPDLRAARRASVPLSKTFFRFRFIGTIPQQVSDGCKLKTERGLQIDAPIRSRLGKRLAGESIRKTEK